VLVRTSAPEKRPVRKPVNSCAKRCTTSAKASMERARPSRRSRSVCQRLVAPASNSGRRRAGRGRERGRAPSMRRGPPGAIGGRRRRDPGPCGERFGASTGARRRVALSLGRRVALHAGVRRPHGGRPHDEPVAPRGRPSGAPPRDGPREHASDGVIGQRPRSRFDER
jgi:hypothetical protein